ncbi:MAG: DUF58 domain-containing protein [Candidatus Hodarchaeales archaeon]
MIFIVFILLLSTVIFRLWVISGVIIPLIIIIFFSLASGKISVSNIEVKRWISRDRTEVKGDPIYIRLTIKNKGKRIPILEIRDKIPDIGTIYEGSNHWFLEIDQGEEITLSYAIQFHKRGRYVLGPISIRGYDIFQFRSEMKEYSILNSISIVPLSRKLKSIPISRTKLIPEAGSIPSLRYKGRDFDFQGVRDYIEGDEERAINWRVTAKFNKLSVNEYAFNLAARVFIIFDHTTSSNRVLEEGVIAAISTSEYLISHRNMVGFYAIGKFVEEIPAAPGRKQLFRINEFLIDVKASYPLIEDMFAVRLKERLLGSLPPHSQIYFISPLINRKILTFFLELLNQGHEITLIVPSLEEITEKYPILPKATQIANALLLLNRSFVMKQIASLGIEVLYWYPSETKYQKVKVRRTK